jgi:hypothetical protein
MAKGKKTGGRDIQKGQVLNPRGPHTLPPDIKEARKLTRTEFERLVNKFMHMTQDEIVASANDPKTVGIELMIGSIVHKAVVQGDQKRLDFLLDRIFGKMIQPLAHQLPDGPIVQARPEIRSLTDEQLELLRGVVVPRS